MAGDPFEAAALRYLAARDRTEAQLADHLARLGASAGRIARVLGRCRAQGYLDDARYAERWARARLARKPMGQAKLGAELAAKGVSESIVRATLSRIYAELTEDDLAHRLLARLSRSPDVLRRQGFSEDTIERVFRHADPCPEDVSD